MKRKSFVQEILGKARYTVYLLLILFALAMSVAPVFAQSLLSNNTHPAVFVPDRSQVLQQATTGVHVVTPPQPQGWWSTAHPYRWEYVKGGHWLAVWACTHAYNQHYVPGDWQTWQPRYNTIPHWTWWLQYPEAKLGVPSHWRGWWPGAKHLDNYVATCYFQ